MSKDNIARYIWLVDTLSKYRLLSRTKINELWQRSPLSDGAAMPERTFFNYRRAVEEIFHIDILCNSAGEYYIDEESSKSLKSLSNWLIDSVAVNNMLQDSAESASRIEIEDVPSARQFLQSVLDAMRGSNKISFSYLSFSRSRPEMILFSPYFLKRYKQRWYVYGKKEDSGMRTYALDRMSELHIEKEQFTLPEETDTEEVFGSIIGVTSSKAEVKTVTIRASRKQAKYLRALPLHKSQQEEIHDLYSLFTYRLKLNYELVSELMALGPEVEVLSPPELRVMVTTRLRETIALYNHRSPRKYRSPRILK